MRGIRSGSDAATSQSGEPTQPAQQQPCGGEKGDGRRANVELAVGVGELTDNAIEPVWRVGPATVNVAA